MDFTKSTITLDIKPYGLERVLSILAHHCVEEVKVDQIRLYNLKSGAVSENSYRPLMRVEFVLEESQIDVAHEVRRLIDNGRESYFESMAITPLLRHFYRSHKAVVHEDPVCMSKIA